MFRDIAVSGNIVGSSNYSYKMAMMATVSATFPSLLPRVADDLWFTLEKRLDDDAALSKEEEEYAASVGYFSNLSVKVNESWENKLTKPREQT